MEEKPAEYLTRPDGLKLAYRLRSASKAASEKPSSDKPTIVFLPGYMSDMQGGKAQAIDRWAESQGFGCLRLDYAGCGESEGAFEDQTLISWRDDVLLLIDQLVKGPVLLIGSSMGGWLMLLVAMQRTKKVTGIFGIAAAPDFTLWGFSQEQKLEILREGKLVEHSDYGPEPYITTRGFYQSGEANRLLHGPIAIDCPARFVHGQEDADVPWQYSLETAKLLRSTDVQTLFVKDGDHRLSRPKDIAIILTTLAAMLKYSL
ncbi:alpha/beta hydrolase [Parasphingorhabdus sp. DH2-15]|uniref:alpha/beta hydrolase n=1 Tax=Parasphingorhabdus sp. DH2-15 TaxID=3444112 RepID=UPI003F6822CF